MGYAYYNQRDYGGSYDGGSFAECACGPTSCAMLAHKYKTKWTPKTVASWMTKHGYATSGTEWGGITAFFNKNGMNCTQYGGYANQYGKRGGEAEKSWKKAMQKGKGTGILLMGYSRFTTGGHYIVIRKIKKQADGTYRYYVWDPYSRGLCGWHTWSSFNGMVKQFYYVDATHKTKKSTTELDGYKCGSRVYYALEKRPVREKANPDAKQVETYKKGYPTTLKKLYRKGNYLWGKTDDGWIALKQLDTGKKYFSSVRKVK